MLSITSSELCLFTLKAFNISLCHPSHYFVLLVTLSDPYMEFIFPIRQTLNGEIKSCFPLLTLAQVLTYGSQLACL